MNTKEMMVAIVTAMLVMTMFASSAVAAMNVNGYADANEWNMDDKLCDDGFDADGMDDTESSGYNITSAWARIEDGTIYFRIDVEGVSGDADSDGFPDSWSDDGDCPNYKPNPDPTGVGGYCPYEIYAIEIDIYGNSLVDFFLRYCNNGVKLYGSDGSTIIAGADVGAAHGQIVELSVNTTDCNLDPAYYCIRAMADTDCWGNEDRTKWVCRIDEPPTAKCSFARTSCGQGELSGTGSSADVVNYSWDFYDDGTYDAYGETALYDIVGTHDVRLMVTDDLGQTDNCTQSVTLTCGPIAVAKADGSDGPVALPAGGKLVTFCGDESYHPDFANGAHIESYHWTILGSDYSTTDKNECFEVFIGTPTTVSLKVVDNFYCEHIDTVTLRVPIIHEPPSDVPIMTPTGIFALIGMLCIVGAGRILTKGRRS